MKPFSCTFTYIFINFFLYPVLVFSQNQYSARLPFITPLSELGISPSEQIWIALSGGEVYYTKQVGKLWHLKTFELFNNPDSSLTDNLLDRVNFLDRVSFFSEDTLMISGSLKEKDKSSFILWSGNQGETCEKVVFGDSSSITVLHKSRQKVWMAGDFQLVYHSENKGKTWKTFDRLRADDVFISIHFASDEKTGLFASSKGILYKTPDNCQTWEKLPTPLSQHKYKPFSETITSDISKIRIFGEYYMIKQEGKIFITKSNLIDWKLLPQVFDFEVSENGNLYTINRDLSISLYDSTFSKIWDSEKKIKDFSVAIAVKNNKLFVLLKEYIYKIYPQEFIESELLTDDIPIQEPSLKVEFEGKQYGFSGKDILCFDSEKKQWYRWMHLNFSVSNAAIFNQQLIISKNLQQHYVVDVKNKSVHPFNIPAKLFENKALFGLGFEQKSIENFDTIIFSRKLYLKEKDIFILDTKFSSSKFLPKMSSKIKTEVVNRMFETVENDKSLKISFKDLNISPQDIKAFKKFIDSEEKRMKKSGAEYWDCKALDVFQMENPDFSFYKNMADSLFLLNPTQIHKSLVNLSGYFENPFTWKRIFFIFEDGQILFIEHIGDDGPNYLCADWTVHYNGLKFKINSIELGEQINQITKRSFYDKMERQLSYDRIEKDKKYAIFKIVKYLYKEKLGSIYFPQKTD